MPFSTYICITGESKIFDESDTIKYWVSITKNWILEVRVDTQEKRFLPTGYVLVRDYIRKLEKISKELEWNEKRKYGRKYRLQSASELIYIFDEIKRGSNLKRELQNVIERHKSRFESTP